MAAKRKSHKGARKRLRVSASGKVRYRRSWAGHLMSGKSGNRKRRLRKPAFCTPVMGRKLRELMGI
jgi:large subunit ribosomal protein L35